MAKYNLNISNIDCASCAAKLEESFKKVKGVEDLSLNYMQEKLFFSSSKEDYKRILEDFNKIILEEEPDAIISETSEFTLILEGLDCASCAGKIEEEVLKLEGIMDANLDFINKKLTYQVGEKNKEHITNKIRQIILSIEPDVKILENKVKDEDNLKGRIINLITGTGLLAIGAVTKIYFNNIGIIIIILAYLFMGYKLLITALKNIIKGKVFDENFLMALATLVAIFLGEYLEAGSVMLFYQVGELFQDHAVMTSRKNIASLMNIRPDYANLILDKEVKVVNPEIVKIGDLVLVKPGEKVPLDGVIIEGETSLDTSSLTGESLPKYLGVNEDVLSGYLNLDGLIKVRVTSLYNQSTVNKILNLIENSSSKKANSEKFITKFSKIYTPVVVILALLVAIILPIFFKVEVNEAIKRACIFLVVSCPCALVLSIPLGFYAGIGGLSKNGVLVKGSLVLENISKIRDIVLDKTGTITRGRLFVDDILVYSDLSKDDVLWLAAHAENNSNHPIALSILEAYNKEINQGLISDVSESAGMGLKLKIQDDDIFVGNKKLMEVNNISIKEYQGTSTPIYIVRNKVHVGTILLSDKIKEDSSKAISSLKNLGINKVAMVTGDNGAVAKMVAKEVGIEEVYSNTLPNDKVEIVKKLGENSSLAFVGDGINDAPVLSLADVGVAMGGLGSDAAIEASDLVLMDDSLLKLSDAIKHSKKTMSVIKQNIVFAILCKVLVLVLGSFGLANMWLGIVADVGVSIICILNSIRLLKL